ncbi:MAG: hypothetical protein WBA23_14115, partial [Tunicatimonas sp.]|uniref:helix-turn-helix domain-containing protein n=1 Tax=Tunicatimonas sp. TaxID=1940096 RepID=UPI003C78FE45
PLAVFAILIVYYENENFPIDVPDPIEVIKFRIDQLGMKQNDLDEIVGFKSRVSEIRILIFQPKFWCKSIDWQSSKTKVAYRNR